jgi:hypothetical protein
LKGGSTRTALIIVGGLILLGVCILLARHLGGAGSSRIVISLFIPLWLIVAAANMWFGVYRQGSRTEDHVSGVMDHHVDMSVSRDNCCYSAVDRNLRLHVKFDGSHTPESPKGRRAA